MYWYLIYKQNIQKWSRVKKCSFLWRIWKRKEKGQKKMTFRSRDLNPRFLVIFPPMIWIFMESEEYKIKSKQASKRDRTLSTNEVIAFFESIFTNKIFFLISKLRKEQFSFSGTPWGYGSGRWFYKRWS